MAHKKNTQRKMLLGVLLFFVGLTLASAPVLAEGWYFDVGRGSASAEHRDFDLEGSDQYTRFGVGYERPDDIAIEAGSLDLGEAADGLVAASTEGVFVAMKGTVRGKQADFFMRVGLYKWQGEVCSGVACNNEDGLEKFIGAGVGFDLGPGSLNAELTFIQMDDAVNVMMSGVSYNILFSR